MDRWTQWAQNSAYRLTATLVDGGLVHANIEGTGCLERFCTSASALCDTRNWFHGPTTVRLPILATA